jgi:hypothetical protein
MVDIHQPTETKAAYRQGRVSASLHLFRVHFSESTVHIPSKGNAADFYWFADEDLPAIYLNPFISAVLYIIHIPEFILVRIHIPCRAFRCPFYWKATSTVSLVFSAFPEALCCGTWVKGICKSSLQV